MSGRAVRIVAAVVVGFLWVACGDNHLLPADASATPTPDSPPPPVEVNHEVWIIDQANTYDSGSGMLDSGGRIHIYTVPTASFPNATPQVIELGGEFAELVRTQTGTVPVRPHYITFNASQTHAIVSFVSSGHVVIFDAFTRMPVYIVDVGLQAHVAIPSGDETFILVANQNGKLLQRINTDYTTNTFTLDDAATLNLATGGTPSGALRESVPLRPDTAPIVPIIDASSDRAFVTLRGGGMFVVNTRTAPMAIVAEYTKTAVEPYGLLGIQKGDKLYFNSNVGSTTYQSILYKLPVSRFLGDPLLVPDSPAPQVIFDHRDRPKADSHGMVLVPKTEGYLWVTDRAANTMIVVKTLTDTVVNEIDLTAGPSSDPAPDQVARSPNGKIVYVSLRGPIPLTQNIPALGNAIGATPGLGVIPVEQDGFTGALARVFPISNLDGAGVEHADPHGLAVRDVRDL